MESHQNKPQQEALERPEASPRYSALAPGEAARAFFPIYEEKSDRPLAYLDSAATALKPRPVIDRLSQYLGHEHANIHRGAYALSANATELYQKARTTVAHFIEAPVDGIVFTRGATESINLVASSLGELLQEGDKILLTLLEHHSNIVPWQILGRKKKISILFSNVLEDGSFDESDFIDKLRVARPKLVAITGLSNALGTLISLERVIAAAREVGARVLVDAAQLVAHGGISVRALDPDFLVFSGHKLYGPTGIGVLYGRPSLLEQMPPYQSGGDMISEVRTDGSTFTKAPQKFEAGTPAIGEAVALAAACNFMGSFDRAAVNAHEEALLDRAYDLLSGERGVTVYGPITRGGPQRAVLSFNVNGVHAHDLSTIADSFNVQIRAGHHCAMPLLDRLGIHSSARISFGLYSCAEDIDQLMEAIREARRLFGML